MNPSDPGSLSAEQRERVTEAANRLHMKDDQIANLVRALNDAERLTILSQKRTEYLATQIHKAMIDLRNNKVPQAREVIRTALARVTEFNVDELIALELDGEIPCAGRMLGKPVVKLNPCDRGLVVRVDDSDNPEFWLEMCISETRLLRALAAVHRIIHAPTVPRSG